MRRKIRFFGVALLACLLAVAAAGCGSKNVNTGADNLACVYDASSGGGNRLIKQVPPASHYKASDQTEVVKIPTSNRFYAASKDRGIADPGAPAAYEGTAKGGVRIFVTGQVRFRFNIAKACQWYAQHGRRNQPLEFNDRTPGENPQGWGQWLNENMGVTMQQILSSVSNQFDWAALVFNYPSNADESGLVPRGEQPGEPMQDVFAKRLAIAFTKKLNENIGGVDSPGDAGYFCGVSSTAGSNCPPLEFQVFGVTADEDLMKQREEVEKRRVELANAEAEAKAVERTQGAILATSRQAQKLLRFQAAQARLTQLKDPAVQKCLLYARAGLDCDGHRPDIIIGGRGG
jgi:hypothetical protein